MLSLDILSFAEQPTYAHSSLPPFLTRLSGFATGTVARFFHEVCGLDLYVFLRGEEGEAIDTRRAFSTRWVDATPSAHAYWGLWVAGRYAQVVRLGTAGKHSRKG